MESVEMERNKVDSALCKTRVGKSGKSGKQFQATWIYYLSGQIAKPDLGKVDSYLSSETECIQKIYCRKNFTEPSLWHLTTTPEHFEDAIWKSVGQYLAGFLVSVNTFATFPTGSEREREVLTLVNARLPTHMNRIVQFLSTPWTLFQLCQRERERGRVARSCLAAAVRFPSLNPILHLKLHCSCTDEYLDVFTLLTEPNITFRACTHLPPMHMWIVLCPHWIRVYTRSCIIVAPTNLQIQILSLAEPNFTFKLYGTIHPTWSQILHLNCKDK